jgi:hypothetical protein
MKKIGLLLLLVFGATHLMAQDLTKRDSLLKRFYDFRLQGKSFKMPNTSKLRPNDSLLNRLRSFNYPGMDSIQGSNLSRLSTSGIMQSPVDHMPIAVLPYKSRMPVYNMPKSTDIMPGSNMPTAPQVKVVPQK